MHLPSATPLLDCSDDIVLMVSAHLLDLFAPESAIALSCVSKRFALLLHRRVKELVALREDARRLACDANGLVKVLTVGIEALRTVEKISRSAGFGGYCFKPHDAALLAHLCKYGAFGEAPRGVLMNMTMGHLGAAGAASIADAIAAGLVLRELCLDDCCVGDEGCAALAHVPGGVSPFRLLESLSMRRNRIGDAGAASLACMLNVRTPPLLRRVALGKNPIGFDGIDALRAACDQLMRAQLAHASSHTQVELELDPPVTRVGRPASRSRQRSDGRGGGSRQRQAPAKPARRDAAHASAPSQLLQPPAYQDWISRILEINIAHDGAMSAKEAQRLLQITDKKPKWLLTQVYPSPHAHAPLATCTCICTKALAPHAGASRQAPAGASARCCRRRCACQPGHGLTEPMISTSCGLRADIERASEKPGTIAAQYIRVHDACLRLKATKSVK